MNSRIHAWLAKHGDIALAVLVVGLVALLIVPIPPWLLDLLIASNLALSLVVLLVALYVPSAVKLPSFPTILLLTTLYRLGLNVSSTKLILLDGDAGEIIDAFGELVVGGNYVVGAVVFLVMVVIQFVVVTKGAERVAEVSARFSLDALPGKQMSIDADLQNRLITQDEARARRAALGQESKLLGAMTGAMKFVQGDAIAGIVIAVVNIVAGLIVGVVQQGLPAGEAARKYALLTIGDGLVSQIPSLVICVAAGLVTTRVSDDNASESGGLARDMLRQVLAHRRALLVAGAFLATLALLGLVRDDFLPPLPFAVLALVAFAGSAAPSTRGADEATKPARTQANESTPRGAPEPLVLAIDKALMPLLAPRDANGVAQVQGSFDAVRRDLHETLGVPLPPIELRVRATLPERGYALLAFDAPLAQAVLDLEHALSTEDKAAFERAGIATTPAELPGTRARALAIANADVERARVAGLAVNAPERVLFAHLRLELARHAGEWVGIQEATALLDPLRKSSPDLVKAALEKPMSLAAFAHLLRQLVREQIPIRDMRRILESVARVAPTAKDAAQLVELVRADMRRALFAHLTRGQDTVHFYMLDPALESLLTEAVTRPLDFNTRAAIVETLARGIDPARHLSRPALVLLANPELKPLLRRLTEARFPDLALAALAEVPATYQRRPLGVIALPAAA